VTSSKGSRDRVSTTEFPRRSSRKRGADDKVPEQFSEPAVLELCGGAPRNLRVGNSVRELRVRDPPVDDPRDVR
jgi:hypothetical protein